MDISFPYTGVTPRYAFTAALSKGTVISRDRIETDYDDVGIFGLSNERQTLSSIGPDHFKNAFWDKYRDFEEETNILFTTPNAGMFGKGQNSPHSLYTSSADLTVIAYNEDLDDSHEAMLETRKEVEKRIYRGWLISFSEKITILTSTTSF